MYELSDVNLSFQILDVPRDASAKDIKKAYYQLAKKYHPDTNKGDSNAQKKFQEVSEAYEILSDDTKRKEFDAYGSGGNPFGNAAGGFGGGGAHAGGAWNFKSNIDPEELFRTIFGDQWRTSAGRGSATGGFTDTAFDFGAPQEYHMNLSFSDAARGVTRELKVTTMDNCAKCKGSGADPGTSPERCPQCSGTGMETVSTGPFMMRSTCRRCHGKGSWIKMPCGDCRGTGQTRKQQTVMVPVPAGIEDGQTVRMPVGKREVFITFRVQKSDYFRRQGSDLHTDAKISVAQALLGGMIRVRGLREDLNVHVPAGTASHSRLLLKGKGISKPSGYGIGDHYVHIRVEAPKKLTDKQRALLQAYAEIECDTPGTVDGFTYNKKGDVGRALRVRVRLGGGLGPGQDVRTQLGASEGDDDAQSKFMGLLTERVGYRYRQLGILYRACAVVLAGRRRQALRGEGAHGGPRRPGGGHQGGVGAGGRRAVEKRGAERKGQGVMIEALKRETYV